MNYLILARYKPFILPLVTFIVVVSLTATVGRFALNKIFETRDQIKELEGKNKLLEAKKVVLSGVNIEEIKKQVKTAVLAVPSENPSIFVLSSIRGQAQEGGLVISNFKVAEKEEAKKTARAVEVSFDLQGSIFSTLSFLKAVENSSPLTKLTNIKFTVSGAQALTKVTATTAWAPLPGELGKTESPLEPVTSAEQELLGKLAGLRQPSLGQVPLSPPAGKADPFAF